MYLSGIRYDVRSVRAKARAVGISSIKAWAEAANVSRPSLYKFLSGDMRLRPDTLRRILQVVGLKPNDIIRVRVDAPLLRIARKARKTDSWQYRPERPYRSTILPLSDIVLDMEVTL